MLSLLPSVLLLLVAPSVDLESIVHDDLRVGKDRFVGAVAIQPETWVTSADYPEGVVQRRASGTVTVAFDITADGRVVNCRVTSGSGFSALDRLPCVLLSRRARFAAQAGRKTISLAANGQMRFHFANPD